MVSTASPPEWRSATTPGLGLTTLWREGHALAGGTRRSGLPGPDRSTSRRSGLPGADPSTSPHTPVDLQGCVERCSGIRARFHTVRARGRGVWSRARPGDTVDAHPGSEAYAGVLVVPRPWAGTPREIRDACRAPGASLPLAG